MLFMKAVRLVREIPQKEAAKRLGVTRACVSYVEANLQPASPDLLAKLAKFYGYTPQQLLTHVDESFLGPGAEARADAKE